MCETALGIKELFPRLDEAAFKAEYWLTRMYWEHATAGRLDGFQDIGSIGGVAALALRSRMALKAILGAKHNETNEIKIDATSILSLFDSGATIVCNQIDRWHDVVRACAMKLASDLFLPPNVVSCNLYLSPEGRGVPMHFDNHEVFIVQLAGSKRWRLAVNRNVKYPTANSGPQLVSEVAAYSHGHAPQRMPAGTSVHMRPGSTLFLPRGVWHQTDASKMSISLTFGVYVPTWAELLNAHLSSRLTQSLAWREPAWLAWSNGKDGHKAEKQWARLKKTITPILEPTELSHLTGHSDGREAVKTLGKSRRRRPGVARKNS